MKTFYYLTVIFTVILGSIMIGVIMAKSIITKYQPLVDLPEEYKLIKSTDKLRGVFDGNGVLHITFDNPQNNR